ncbi:PREDICTED: pollen receptor-like kinase 4 [Nelumbo nucifera]|uniref:non-specific serine/threonine protein kinase n=2 Tax=Nelumbo nucifera TaxID=4432 RepID=A0A822ZB55_NELNU|nr:PREDICTED: pollen receptor-like kinase 4 [Nelumbo nucifera]DAD38758.1 TPA_asm: hypothetical protein HUJ06_013080 [Nelumbo nucifera]
MAGGDPYWLLNAFLITLLCIVIVSSGDPDADILLKFKKSLANDAALSNWNSSTNPCVGKWVGVKCWEGNRIWSLKLENMGLTGQIDVDSLVGLPYLRGLSFMNNSFDGPMPKVKVLRALKSLYLSHNRFSGEIPDGAFAGMGLLKKVYLSHNSFSGKIPSSLLGLSKLLELRLDGNQFEGNIPDFQQKGLQLLNVSNNYLQGPIPASLSNMDSSSFSGNDGLCGKPLKSCDSNKNKKSPLSKTVIILICIGLALVILGAVLVVLHRQGESRSGKAPENDNQTRAVTCEGDKMERGTSGYSGNNNKKVEPPAKLTFVRDDREKFELNDMLRASAEILGNGSFGSCYKAVLSNGAAIVVKRYKYMNNIEREEFQEYMKRLGTLTHPNLLPLMAYYYRKEEKLLVTDFIGNGSLASKLHGKQTTGELRLDWPTRLNIIKGVAKGLAFLYDELPNLTLPHGHLKSSNVILNESLEPLLTDYGLLPVINQEHAVHLMVAYKSPEYAQCGRTTKKSDVWCLGILILEILTGKFPAASISKQGNKGSDEDLACWVSSAIREERAVEIFDKQMEGTKNAEGEVLKLLNIGLCCCEADTDKRWDIKEAVERIEELKERDNDDDFYSLISEGEMPSTRSLMAEIELSL